MLKVNGAEHSYDKAINALNFDKLGHPTGKGSWGILFTIDGDDPIDLFIGIKFDVLTVATSKFLAFEDNMTRYQKSQVEMIRRSSSLSLHGTDDEPYIPYQAPSENVKTFYVSTHKIEVDVVELARSIYQRVLDIEEYFTISKNLVFRVSGLRTARAISAKMMRTYEGSLEEFGTIFSGRGEMHLLNGIILSDIMIADEILCTIWLTPHDTEDSAFWEEGEVLHEDGDEYVSSLGGSIVVGEHTEPLYTSDRRGYRHGYMDILAENPNVNSGYSAEEGSIFDTYFWTTSTDSAIHRHKTIIPLDASYYNQCPRRLLPLVSAMNPSGALSDLVEYQDRYIKMHSVIEIGEMKTSGIDKLSELCMGSFIDATLDELGDEDKIASSSEYIDQCKRYLSETLVLPISVHNVFHKWTELDGTMLIDHIIFIYHPVLDKTIFLDPRQADIVRSSSTELVFLVDGLEYGYTINGNYGWFLWAGIKKIFRVSLKKWTNMRGAVYDEGELPDVSQIEDPEGFLAVTDSLVDTYTDLAYEGEYASIMMVPRDIVTDIVKKKTGVINGEYALGISSGNIKMKRSWIWM